MTPRLRTVGPVPVALALLLAACAGNDVVVLEDGTAVDVTMTDVAYDLEPARVAVGSTVTFRFTNRGATRHEAVVGDRSVQQEHEDEMAGMDDMPTDPDVPSLSLAPGESGELAVTFDEAGEVLIGCHEPGHYEAGMVASVTVE